jgi:glycosyltransferase involved in cell wall biosynthesis
MDVLHVIHQFPPESRGGSESYVKDMAQRQRARGLDAHVLTGSKHWRPEVVVDDVEQVEGIPVHRMHRNDLFFDHHTKMWHPEVERQFAELLQKWRPKLLHVHHWLRLTCNLVEIAAQNGVPAVLTLHDYHTSCPRAFRRRPDAEACTRVLSPESCVECVPKYGHEPKSEIAWGIDLYRDHYLAEVSLARAVLVAVGSTADLLSATTGIPRDRYEVLPLGYRRRWPGQGALPAPKAGEPVRFSFWGTLGKHKGVNVLLRAFALLDKARPGRAELHLLGGTEIESLITELHTLAKGLPVTFHGAFDATQLRATAPHVGVFPSTCIETFGLVLDECFELGLPCITSDLGALPQRAGAAGLHVRAADAQDLARAMQRFVDEPQLWSELRGRLPPLSPTLDEHVDALLRVYERARTQPPPKRLAEPVSVHRRILFLQQQRESGLNALVKPGGPQPGAT